MEIIDLEGSTPLDPNEIEGLIPPLRYQRELNLLENEGIYSARVWALSSRKLKKELLIYSGMLLLHQKMFEGIWEWAGCLRRTEKNIGNIPPHLISSKLSELMANISYQKEQTTIPIQDIAISLYYNLVYIHPFPNGNGRHARLVADLLIHYSNGEPLTWGKNLNLSEKDLRKSHLAALQEADRSRGMDLSKLTLFAKS
jgi:Fic-DOC domain mobile mystery protein B